MKVIKYILCSLVISLLGNQFVNAENNNDAQFLKITKEYQLNEDGSYSLRYTKKVKLLTHVAFNNLYGETFIIHNPNYQTIQINECYTIQADGKKIVAPANAFNMVLPKFAADAPSYQHLRELVITHTGLEVGATIYLDYTIITDATYANPQLIVNEILQEESPIDEYLISVEYPAKKNLIYNQYNCPQPEYVEKDKTIKLSWSLKNIPASSLEPFQAYDKREAPRVAFTSISRLNLMKHLGAQFTIATKPIINKVMEIIPDTADYNQKIQIITDYIINNLETVNIPLKYNNYYFRDIDEVFQTAYGTHIEKSALFVAMLNIAGVMTTPILSNPKWGNEGFVLTMVDGKITPVKENNFWIEQDNEFPIMVLDLTTKSNKYIYPLYNEIFMWNDQEKSCHALTDYSILPPLMKKASIDYKFTINGVFDKDKILKLDADLLGKTNVILMNNDQINKAVVKDSATLSIKNNEDYYSIKLPTSNEGVDSWKMTALSNSERKTILEIPYTINESYKYSLTLPVNAKIVNEMMLDLKNSIGEILIELKVNKNKVDITRKININKKLIQPNEYKEFKELMNLWNTDKYNTLIIK